MKRDQRGENNTDNKQFSQDFVQIHPFADGNGRMSQLILNEILLKYLGCMAPICGSMSEVANSEEAREREYDVYISTCIRAGNRRKNLEIAAAAAERPELSGKLAGRLEAQLWVRRMRRKI